MIRHYWSTTKHKAWVLLHLIGFSLRLLRRGLKHDLSKYRDPEASRFAEVLPALEDTTYGSEEYDELLDRLDPALQHHYAMNRHHPEHFEAWRQPLRGMHLVDVVEMFCDWRAATRRHKDGDIQVSVAHNAGRYGYGGELLYGIFLREAEYAKFGVESDPDRVFYVEDVPYKPWNPGDEG